MILEIGLWARGKPEGAVAVDADYVLTITPDEATMSRLAADIVSETITRLPEATITLPTGSTPLGMYAELVERVRRGELDCSRVHIFCLDEYLGLTPRDSNSLTGWLERVFLIPAGIDATRVHALPATDPDPTAAAARYEAALAARGGLDLAVLGLGPNGHIAYNEPGSSADSRTRVLHLTDESVAQAAAYWEGAPVVPERAMTIGVATLLEAKRIVLIVAGASKAEILRRSLRDPMSAAVPASWLRLAGARLTIIADEAATSQLG
jgi:glucosamine-6-phosphate deaminase